MERWPRTVLHVDLDAFFAAVEQRDQPTLRGRPVLVGGSTERGVVAAASYEARRFGVRSAMPMAEALRRCPHAVVVPHRMARYADSSRQFFAILDRFSPLVEPLSLDEGFLDVTGAERLLGDARAIAHSIKQAVRAELSLVASVGAAPSKFIAKIASDIDKPDGLCVVDPERVLGFLHPLPLARLWGVGAVMQDKLRRLGLRTIGDVAHYPETVLRGHIGDRAGAHLAALARGEDARSVEPRGAPVSIGHEQTFEVDIDRRDAIEVLLLGQADRVAARLRSADLRARVVQIKIKYADFHLVTRRRTLPDATVDGGVIGRTAVALLDELGPDRALAGDFRSGLGWPAGNRPAGDRSAGNRPGPHRAQGTRPARINKRRAVRLCGVSVTGLEPRDGPRQLTLGEPDRRRGERLGDAIDQIHARFGDGLVKRAVHVRADDDSRRSDPGEHRDSERANKPADR